MPAAIVELTPPHDGEPQMPGAARASGACRAGGSPLVRIPREAGAATEARADSWPSGGSRCPAGLGSEDPEGVGADHGVSSAPRLELAVDVHGVLLHRLLGDAQQPGDLSVGVVLVHQL